MLHRKIATAPERSAKVRPQAGSAVGILIGVLVVLVVSAGSVLAQPGPVAPEVIAKNLAENILGEQTVTHVKVSHDGEQIDISWESATYKPANSRETTRALLKAEAALACGAIMGIMKPGTLRFEISLGKKTLAAGEMSRSGGFTITYAAELRGAAFPGAALGGRSVLPPSTHPVHLARSMPRSVVARRWWNA